MLILSAIDDGEHVRLKVVVSVYYVDLNATKDCNLALATGREVDDIHNVVANVFIHNVSYLRARLLGEFDPVTRFEH